MFEKPSQLISEESAKVEKSISLSEICEEPSQLMSEESVKEE